MNLNIIFSSSTGNTEHVLGQIVPVFSEVCSVSQKRAELCGAEDLLEGDILLLACGTWNTDGPQGQLHPFMQRLLRQQSADIDLAGKKVIVVGLGDSRYRYTCRAADYMQEFIEEHGGEVVDVFRVIDEPYGQEEEIENWSRMIVDKLRES